MEKNDQMLGYGAAGLLFLGALLPIVSIAIAGGVSIFDASKIVGLILIGAAAATGWFAHNNNFKPLLATGGVGAAITLYAIIRYMSLKSEMTGGADANNPFAQMAAGMVRINLIGWIPLIAGTALALWLGNRARTSGSGPNMPNG